MVKFVVKAGINSPFKNPIRKKGLILPFDIVKVFNAEDLVIKGRVIDLILHHPAEFYKSLVSQKDFRIDLRQYRELMKNLGTCCPDLADQIREKKSGR